MFIAPLGEVYIPLAFAPIVLNIILYLHSRWQMHVKGHEPGNANDPQHKDAAAEAHDRAAYCVTFETIDDIHGLKDAGRFAGLNVRPDSSPLYFQNVHVEVCMLCVCCIMPACSAMEQLSNDYSLIYMQRFATVF